MASKFSYNVVKLYLDKVAASDYKPNKKDKRNFNTALEKLAQRQLRLLEDSVPDFQRLIDLFKP
jgi:hypothetical protein